MTAKGRDRNVVVADREESLDMATHHPRVSSTPGESGFALILALLALLLLTFLGLTLAVTTSTELQIATNYRWSEQARYAAEAGAEVGKVRLRNVLNWRLGGILPPVRTDGGGVPLTWPGSGTPAVPPAARVINGVTMRDYENASCDVKGNGMGYGWVLAPGADDAQQYVSTFNTLQTSGAFTIWIRRPLWIQPTGNFSDWGQEIVGPPLHNASDDTLIMTVEGVAPFTSAASYTATGAQGGLVARNKAVYTIEVPLSQEAAGTLDSCQWSNAGQTGGGAHNTGFGGCTLGDEAMTSARSGSTSTGTGNQNTGVR
jgi:PilX N-terminal